MVQLNQFSASVNSPLKKSKPIFILWYLFKIIFISTPFPWPSFLKTIILRSFGASIGERVLIKPNVNIHYPWNLRIKNDVWIGEYVFLLNFEMIDIGSNVCISQRAFLCTGNHNFRDISFSYKNGPIKILDGAWIGASVFISPDVSVGTDSVVSAGVTLTKSIADNLIVSPSPCVVKGKRWR